ncbi:MAG: hypothetical protein H7320_03120 [Ferruginibacter sp.]|nr:hypothetical protein [Ferruginibacter sp.]
MNEVNKILLEQKRKQLQLKLSIQNWLQGWVPIFNAIRQWNKLWSFEYFDCANETDLSFWEKSLEKSPLAALEIPLSAIKTPLEYYVHDKMRALFPSSLSLRYMPVLLHREAYETDSALMLTKIAETLNIFAEEEVFLFYTRFTPVLRLPFSAVCLLREEEIMNPENLCIMPLDYRWLIFRSLENEWVWGEHKV